MVVFMKVFYNCFAVRICCDSGFETFVGTSFVRLVSIL
jgi:hypothetical protein